jgi:Bacterial SH3 domain
MIRLTLLLIATLVVGFIIFGKDMPEDEQARLTRQATESADQAPPTVPEEEAAPLPDDGSIRPVNPNAEAAPETAILPITQPRVIADEGRSAPLNLPPPEPVEGDPLPEGPVTPVNDGQVRPDPPARGQDGFTEGVPADPTTLAETTWFVAADKVNLRAGESTDFEVVGAAFQGEPLTLLSDPNAEWVQVRTQGGIEAFVKTEFLSQSGPLQ